MLAAYHGHAPLVSLLLQHGADPNRLNDRGQSPLAGVVFKNERDVIRVLLDAGADPELGQPSALEATKVRISPSFPDVDDVDVLINGALVDWFCVGGLGVSTGGIRGFVQGADREVEG